MRLELPGARRARVRLKRTPKPAGARRWRSISPRARRRRLWGVAGVLSVVIAAQLVALLLTAGGPASAGPQSSRLGPLDAVGDDSGGLALFRPLGEPLPMLFQRVTEVPSGVLARVPDLIEEYERVPWGLPVSLERGWVSSEFGMRVHPIEKKIHTGIDLAVDTGTRVNATARGVVTFADRNGGYGKVIYVDHENGMTTRYAHLSKLLVQVGDHVMRGQTIALSGATGNVTGEHLHYEVRLDGEPVNPRVYLPKSLPTERPEGM
jgi:murein DD-endopeptidase MepM/ murein hydrolase activator NlpD